MAITAKEVAALREITGAGMMDCKRALVEADGDMEAAKDILRQRGQAKGAKREGKATGEGTLVVAAKPDASQAVVLELNCETDFVGRSDTFRALAQSLADQALAGDLTDGSQIVADDAIADATSRLGEKIRIGHLLNWKAEGAGAVAVYLHTATGRVAVPVEIGLDAPAGDKLPAVIEIARELGMQAAALKPVCLSREDVPAHLVAHEREVLRSLPDMASKPPQIQDKMIDGRMGKFYQEICLLEQIYARDNTKSVTQYVKEAAKTAGLNLTVKRFERLEVGRAAAEAEGED